MEGEFTASDAVNLVNSQGEEIGKGIVNYSSSELKQIKGEKSLDIANILGYSTPETVIHRDNLVILS